MKIRCLVIDDKPLAISVLADYIRRTDFLELAGSTTNPLEGLKIVQEQAIQLVFLDIQMPELNGLSFMKLVGKRSHVILTTAYSKYALEGYEHDVTDYLMKPISFERFYRAAEKANNAIRLSGNSLRESNNNEVNSVSYLFIKTEYRIQKIDLADILFVEGLQNYVSIHTSTSRILSLQTMKKMEAQLPAEKFLRVHRSFIIALKHISFIEKSRIRIGSAEIPIGNSYRSHFLYRIEQNADR